MNCDYFDDYVAAVGADYFELLMASQDDVVAVISQQVVVLLNAH